MKKTCFVYNIRQLSMILAISTLSVFFFSSGNAQPYRIVGTGVTDCYNNSTLVACPALASSPFYGQFPGLNLPSFLDNGNGSISDLNTGLTWQSSPDANGNNNGVVEKADKLTWPQIQARVLVLNTSNYAGHDDWRIPSIKELYSLTDWKGTDPSGLSGSNTAGLVPFLDTTYFPFAWGQVNLGERIIDVQYASATMYNELSFSGSQQLFGFNFADGRIKGYDLVMPDGSDKIFSFIAVRGNTSYGLNHFVDNGNLTVTDSASGLMWAKDDSQTPMNWEQALAWAQSMNGANYCGFDNWRLPNAKELQSIVDYTRSPGTTFSAAIDPIFNCTAITNEAGYPDWPWFWTSTTHGSYNGTTYGGGSAVYICFGSAPGWIRIPGNSYYSYVDVHGAGAQRSDPKGGTYVGDLIGLDSLGNSVYGRGPQGDVLRVNNFVRLVRDVNISTGMNAITPDYGFVVYPNPSNGKVHIALPNNVQEIIIINSLGQLTERRSVDGLANSDFEFPANGVYFLQICTFEGGCFTEKIIVAK